MTVDASLLKAWFAGWARARGAPPPIEERDGWRIEVGWPRQRRRHLFIHAGDGLREAATTITEPFVYLKCCIPSGHLRAMLPMRWTLDPEAAFMAIDSLEPSLQTLALRALPQGLECRTDRSADAVIVRIVEEGDGMCASGRVVQSLGWAVFDRIETEVDWRGQGLATHVMQNLMRVAARNRARGGLLVATTAGEALYRRLGWRMLSPYASAFIGDDPADTAEGITAPPDAAR